MIELRETNSMGWGVFASRQIKAGRIITRSVATPFSEASWENIKKCFFGAFVFMDRDKYPEKKSGFVAWGMATMINHHDEPNADIETTRENKHLEAIVRATRTIHKGEQIFIKYANCADDELYPWYEDPARH